MESNTRQAGKPDLLSLERLTYGSNRREAGWGTSWRLSVRFPDRMDRSLRQRCTCTPHESGPERPWRSLAGRWSYTAIRSGVFGSGPRMLTSHESPTLRASTVHLRPVEKRDRHLSASRIGRGRTLVRSQSPFSTGRKARRRRYPAAPRVGSIASTDEQVMDIVIPRRKVNATRFVGHLEDFSSSKRAKSRSPLAFSPRSISGRASSPAMGVLDRMWG